MTVRLPIVGGDVGTWGTVENNWLATMPFFNVKAAPYNAAGDGITDDTSAIAAARSAVNAVGGGIIYYPPGTYVTGNQTLYNNVHDMGAGPGITILQLKSGSNTDLFSAFAGNINPGSSFGGGSSTGVSAFSLSNMTLDGNKSGQSSGTSWCLRFYGYGFLLSNIRMINGYSGGMQCDWNPASQPNHQIGPKISNLLITDCNGTGLDFNGPSDAQVTNLVVSNSSVQDMHVGVHAGGFQCANLHVWNQGTGSTIGCLIEADACCFEGFEAEAQGLYNTVLLGNDTTIRGRIFAGNLGSTAGGLQFGQNAGQTPYPNQVRVSGGLTVAVAPVGCNIDCCFDDIGASAGCINFVRDGGQNRINAICRLPSGGLAYTGTPFLSADQITFLVYGTTRDGSLTKNGGFNIGISSQYALRIREDVGFNDIFVVDTYSSPPNAYLYRNGTFHILDNSGNHLMEFANGQILFGSALDAYISRGGSGIVQINNTFATSQSASNAQAYVDTFAHADQSGWPSPWSHPVGSATLAIASNEGTLTGQNARQIMLYGARSEEDWTIRTKQTVDAGSAQGIVLRDDGTGTNGYSCYFTGTQLKIDKIVSGTATNLVAASFTTIANKFYRVRFQISGTTLNGKIWADGTAEPGGWTATVTDSTYGSAGQVGLRAFPSASAVVSYDRFQVNAALANNETIITENVGVMRVNPGGNVTGIILQPGTVASQQMIVENESAFSITFDVVATSNVADGTSAVIAANRAMFFIWNSSTSKWYRS